MELVAGAFFQMYEMSLSFAVKTRQVDRSQADCFYGQVSSWLFLFWIIEYGQNYLKATKASRVIPEKSDQSSHSSTVLSFLTGRMTHSLRQSPGHLWLFWNNLSTEALRDGWNVTIIKPFLGLKRGCARHVTSSSYCHGSSMENPPWIFSRGSWRRLPDPILRMKELRCRILALLQSHTMTMLNQGFGFFLSDLKIYLKGPER